MICCVPSGIVLLAAVFGSIILKEDICRPEYLVAFLLIAGGIWIANRGPAHEANQS